MEGLRDFFANTGLKHLHGLRSRRGLHPEEAPLKLRSLTRHRPSAAIVISSAALFMSLGGVGYAASGLIGTSQIKDNAVTYSKIAPNSVGKVRLANAGVINSKIAPNAVSYQDIQPNAVGVKRANVNQLQARVKGTCPGGSAVATVDNKGAVTCNATVPTEYGSSSATAFITATATPVSSLVLPAGSDYLAFGNVQVSATSTGTVQRVTFSCTMTVGTTTETRSQILRTDGTAGDASTASLPLQAAGAAGTSTIACNATVPTGSTLPTSAAIGQINAIQTAATS